MPFRALTVGDGDLSFSLALKRAYPQINVTASTLIESPAELRRTYANAVDTSKEFQETFKEQILYGIDATKLEEKIEETFDIVLFNHPHLGDGSLFESEQRHAERHHALLAHYFWSAQNILKKDGRVHVQLCGNQPRSWDVLRAARGLECVAQTSTACSLSGWLFQDGDAYELAEVRPHYPAKRKYRNGALGSKHVLARYGFRHQRTEGDLFSGSVRDIHVEQSINFVFARKARFEPTAETDRADGHECSICKLTFENEHQLKAHLDAPALPDVVTGAYEYSNKDIGKKKVPQSKTRQVEKQPIANQSFEEATILTEATVDAGFDSKRLKWLCRQDSFSLSEFIKSKSQCEGAIKKGRVFVNRQVALDSGRIVREGDVVSLAKDYVHADSAHETIDRHSDSGVRVVREMSFKNDEITIKVVYKPVGVRCVGAFSPDTLEMITKRLVEGNLGAKSVCCRSVSKLDTGVQGLCVLLVGPSKNMSAEALRSLRVSYTFTALVHGNPPDEWREGTYVDVPTEGLRQWKRQKRDAEHAREEASPIKTSSQALDLDDALFVTCIDSLQIGEQHIATVTVTSRFDHGRLGNVISFVLRKLGHPVVNDRFGKREYSALPRRMKNIVKQKVCIGCYQVDVECDSARTKVVIDSHKRTQCRFWREILP